MLEVQTDRRLRGRGIAIPLALAAICALAHPSAAQAPVAPTATPAPGVAPTPPAPTPGPPEEDLSDDPGLTREERIRRHTLRLQKFLTEANTRAEQEKQAAAARGEGVEQAVQGGTAQPNPAGATPTGKAPLIVTGNVPITGPAEMYRIVPSGAGGAANAAEAAMPPPSLVPFRLSRAIVYLRPFQVLSRVGDTFQTTVLVFNSSGKAFDEVTLNLKYDPLVVIPEDVNDAPLYARRDGAPELRINRSMGMLHYSVKLSEGILKTTTTLMTITWRALNPVMYSEIGFSTNEGDSIVGNQDGNLLGYLAAGERTGGTLPGTVVVAPRHDSPRTLVPPLSQTALASIDQRVEIQLQAAPEEVTKDREWVVSLVLRNDAALPFNDLNVRILFDPEKLEVADWDPGNWIREGVNIYDGFAHAKYPFEVLRANSADNQKGEIHYHMATAAAQYFPGGEFARIKFKARADASLKDVWIDCDDPVRSGGTTETDASFLGASVMFPPRRPVEAEQRPAPQPLRRPNS